MRTAGLTLTVALLRTALSLGAQRARMPASAPQPTGARRGKPRSRDGQAGGAFRARRTAVLICRATGPTRRSRRSSGCVRTRRWC